MIVKTLYQRVKDLLVKMISVKGTFALTASAAYFREPNNTTLIGFIAGWALFIGSREFEKIKGILPKVG